MQTTFRAAALALGASALAGFWPGAEAAWTFSNDAAFHVRTFTASETLGAAARARRE